MSYYRITGGNKLRGTIEVTSGKNSPIALMCAALLVKGPVTLHDVSRVEEVERILEILESIGVAVTWQDAQTLTLNASKKLHMADIHKESCRKTRISLLLMGALAARETQFKIYKSGGCRLGNRTVRPHLFALEKFGIKVTSTTDFYEVKNEKLHAAHVVMYESGDTATENAIMAAVLAPGKTTIKFASANYMVQDLCYFLLEAGAKIEGIGTTTLSIQGVKKLKSVTGYCPIPDPVDAMAWISLGATTKSPITVKNCPLDFLELELENLHIMGQKFELKNRKKSKSGHFDVVDVALIPSSLVALPDKLAPRPYPGLNIDALPLFLPVLTQAKGQTLIHDWVYENRAIYYLELQKLGAQLILMDPHRVLVQGPVKLQANEVVAPPAIRPAMAVLIAMVAAKGTSTLRNIYPLERAYENLVERLQSLGVKIQKMEE